MQELLKTNIENKTKFDLSIIKCTRDGLVPKAEVKRGSRYIMWHCMDWTFQDYVVETKHGIRENCLKISINSDMCCDYQRMILKESLNGELVMDKEARKTSSLCQWGCFSGLMLSCLESKEDQSGLSIKSDSCWSFEKIYKPLKKVVDKATHKPSPKITDCGEDVGFGYGYHQLLLIVVDGSLRCVETFRDLLTKETK